MRRYFSFGYRKRCRHRKRSLVFFIFMLLSVLILSFIEKRLPLIQEKVLPAAMHRFAQEKLSDTVPAYLSETAAWQNEKSVVPDTYYLSQLKASLTQKLQEKLAGKAIVWIPIGDFTDTAILSGRGVRIPLVYSVNGTVNIEFFSELSGAGINRTKYSILMEIRVDLLSISSQFSESVTVQSNYLIYESVIDGAVPLEAAG